MTTARIAVIGAGFSGLLTALHLLARRGGPAITLIERGDGFGLGLAYGACQPEHLLNVRAGNMSAFPDRPGHFVDWLRRDGGRPDADGAAFASRQTYGAYLQQLLREAVAAEPPGRLDLIRDEATALRRRLEGGIAIELAMGRRLVADAAVLAPGNLPPPAPRLIEADGLTSPRYHPDPWRPGVLEAIQPLEAVLLLGAGLTMVDMALGLKRRGHKGPILALSRHGLLPRAHAGAPPPPSPPPPIEPSLAGSLKAFRRRAAAEADWRAAFDSLRPITQDLWIGLDEERRRRFLRHLRPYWEVHRHRLAPAVADELVALRASGALEIAAGRLAGVRAVQAGLEATWRPRGEVGARRLVVQHLVNCTGPEGDVERADDRLLRRLLADGLIRPDSLRLGVDVDARRRVIDAQGHAAPDLTAVGPVTRGAFWESTAVPDIRLQAAEVAADLLERWGAAQVA